MSNYFKPNFDPEAVAEMAFKARKTLQLSDAIQARFHEGLEAVNSLPRAEKGPYVEQVRQMFFDRVKVYTEAFETLTDFLKMADDSPDFLMKGHQPGIGRIRAFHAEMLATLKSIQPKLGNL
jgi:hypothetical protein